MLHHDKLFQLPLLSPFLHMNESSVTDVCVCKHQSHLFVFQNFSAYEEACQCLKHVTLLHHSGAMLLLLYFQRGWLCFLLLICFLSTLL